MIIKPMLAATLTDINKIKFPVLATPKIDGIRCLRINGRSVSRTFKNIPNRYIQEKMKNLPDGLDGELIVGETFQETTSGVMSQDGKPGFLYMVFDFVPILSKLTTRYDFRMALLEIVHLPMFCTKLLPAELNTQKQLKLYEEAYLNSGIAGAEGIMIRQPDSPYKCGRSTENEEYLLKIKRFKDREAVIVDLEEQMENNNALELDNLGHAKRSSKKEGMAGKNTLGAFVVRDLSLPTPDNAKEFRVGTGIGLTKKKRQYIWNNRKEYLGKIITYKYQELGTLALPRFPIFKGFRHVLDMS